MNPNLRGAARIGFRAVFWFRIKNSSGTLPICVLCILLDYTGVWASLHKPNEASGTFCSMYSSMVLHLVRGVQVRAWLEAGISTNVNNYVKVSPQHHALHRHG